MYWPPIHNEEKLSMNPTEVKESVSLTSLISKMEGVVFVVLNLKDASGKVVSHNVYWLSGNNDFKSINSLPKTTVQTKVMRVEKKDNETRWTIQFSNPTDKLAFFIHPMITNGNEEVLPSFWSANYFSLEPGESVIVTVGCPPAKLNGGSPVLKVEGWNVGENEIAL